MNSERESLQEALRRMPVPELRHDFADRALAKAVAASRRERRAAALGPIGRWETWLGAGVGAAVAVLVTVAILRPQAERRETPAAAVTLAIDETRHIDVVIDSERTLEDATIRLATTGAVQLEGFEDREIEWQARLERGRNVLSLPVVAREAGPAQLIAVIEHEGRSRRIAIHLVVTPRDPQENV